MLFKILKSKKGFTVSELMTVVTVMAILTAVAVPLFTSAYNGQMKKDCQSQCTVLEAQVKEGMYGMIDNGAAQYKRDSALNVIKPETVWIDFSKVQSDHKEVYEADDIAGNSDDDYDGKECFVLIKDQGIAGELAFTMSDLRGGYRPNANQDYEVGCKSGYYLKKKKLENIPFYTYLANSEIPICPFADYEDKDNTNDYRYYIFEDGTVICSCPECHEE